MRGALLKSYAWLIGYRFQKYLKDPLDLPSDYSTLPIQLIRDKATTSLTATGLFLAFSIAVLVAVMGLGSYSTGVISALHGGLQLILDVVTVTLLYLIIRQERILSAAGQKGGRYLLLRVLLVASLVLFLIVPLLLPQAVLKSVFTLVGFLAIIASALFQFFSVELYDSAAGWRGGEGEAGRKLRFHLAGLASHSYVVGVSFTLLGASLLLVQINFWIGSSVTLIAMFALVAVSEIERELWERREEKLYLSTTGCKTGQRREFKISFVKLGTNFYTFAKKLPKSQWAQNIQRTPRVQVRCGDQSYEAKATLLDPERDAAECEAAQKLAREKYGWDPGRTVRIMPNTSV